MIETPVEDRHYVRRGDLLLFMSGSNLGSLVREGQRVPGRPKCPANHVGWCVKSGEVATNPHAEMVEAASHFRRNTLWERHQRDHVWCYRLTAVPRETLDAITEALVARVGEPYPFLDMVSQLLDRKLFGGRCVTRWLTRPVWGQQCSSAVDDEARKFGVRLSQGRSWASSPGDVMEWVTGPGRRELGTVLTFSGYPFEYAPEVPA